MFVERAFYNICYENFRGQIFWVWNSLNKRALRELFDEPEILNHLEHVLDVESSFWCKPPSRNIILFFLYSNGIILMHSLNDVVVGWVLFLPLHPQGSRKLECIGGSWCDCQEMHVHSLWGNYYNQHPPYFSKVECVSGPMFGFNLHFFQQQDQLALFPAAG